ncbi:MAG: 3-oxoacyl-ACP synthase [Lachnospiraceae bacterium]|nr:3-oxoacyl-ACP synthase [Lachnospiraceae bacterium]
MKMRNLKIYGCGSTLASTKIMFGDQTRYRLGDGQTILDLAEVAIKKALEDAGMKMSDIDCIIGGMATPLQAIPCNAALIHERVALGMDIPAMDINTTCTSFVTALDMAAYMTDCGRYSRILIVSGDTASAALNPNQRESYELFSDVATAFIVGKSDTDSGVLFAAQKTWSEGAHDTEIRGGCGLLSAFKFSEENKEDYYFDMKGIKVLKLSAYKLPGFLKESLEKAEMSLDDIDIIVPHQASKALDMIMPRLGIDKSKYINRVKELGNMISASIPYALCDAIHDGQIVRGNTVMLIGTAAGLTSSMVILKY